MEAKFFPTSADLRSWFEKNHEQEKELWIGYHKKATGIESIDWSQSVDQALCFGWIDGIRNSINEKSYKIRFTPRNPKSHWSAVNLKKVDELKKSGQMTKAGLHVYNIRDKEKSEQAAYEQKEIKLSKEFENKIRANNKAYEFFETLAPSYKRASIHWIMSAKKEETRLSRLEVLIQSSEEGQKVPPLRKSK
jgi:uncharacterized protein YdeI (YjbR/CyaY-like superfamily)